MFRIGAVFPVCHRPPTGRRSAPPDDRLQRAIQYVAASGISTAVCGILERPVKPDDDSGEGLFSLSNLRIELALGIALGHLGRGHHLPDLAVRSNLGG